MEQIILQENQLLYAKFHILFNNWIDISKKLGNNQISEVGGNTIIIPNCYYDFCTLSKIAFEPFNITAKLNQANLLVTLRFPRGKTYSMTK